MSIDKPIDELTAHYRDTLLLIQDTVLADVPRLFRPKQWDDNQLRKIAERLRDANTLALEAYHRDTVLPAIERTA